MAPANYLEIENIGNSIPWKGLLICHGFNCSFYSFFCGCNLITDGRENTPQTASFEEAYWQNFASSPFCTDQFGFSILFKVMNFLPLLDAINLFVLLIFFNMWVKDCLLKLWCILCFVVAVYEFYSLMTNLKSILQLIIRPDYKTTKPWKEKESTLFAF